jgi:DNA repair photolyase
MKIGITERGDAALNFAEWHRKLGTVDGVILITKNPIKLFEYREYIPPKSIIHTTITGHGGTALEPNVPVVEEAIEAYKKLVAIFGSQRVVLRVDPIIPTVNAVTKALHVIGQKQGRFRVSMLDLYPHVKGRLFGKMPDLAQALTEERLYGQNAVHLQDSLRLPALKHLARMGAEICGEPGIECTGCVSIRDLEIMGIMPKGSGKSKQRSACACVAEKTELLTKRHPCAHGCLYCYWKN